MSCDECGSILMPGTGESWVSITEGDERSIQVYCVDCGQIYRVEQKIKHVEKEGNIQEIE